jgi:AcrR family transcriptional regulator
MARPETAGDNRDRILRAAEALFAENGFDATSVGSVAEAAGVNKALIYYYFEGKDDLLASLFEDLAAAVRERSGTPASSAGLREKVADEVAFLADRRRALALLLMQALREGDEAPALFEIAGGMIAEELDARGFPSAGLDGATSEARRRALVHEFFTGTVPVVVFVALRDRFCAHFGLDADEAETAFLDALERSHFRSHVEPE